MSSAEEVRNNPEAWGFEHFKSIFKTKMEAYMHKLCEKKKPKKILLCMVYYPGEEYVEGAWPNDVLKYLRYDENPKILQAAMRHMFEEAISKVEFPQTQVIPFALYSVLNGKTNTDYCQRVEPSPTGGAKMAKAFLRELELKTPLVN
jgi:hypothetical protein